MCFGKREDRAGWMDGSAANLGNRQMATPTNPSLSSVGLSSWLVCLHILTCTGISFLLI